MDGVEQRVYLCPEFVNGSFGGFSEQCLELGEEFFDGVEIGRVGWEIEQGCACCLDGLPDSCTLVAAEIVQDYDVCRLQRWASEWLNPGEEHLSIDRLVGDHRSGQPIMVQSSDEGCRFQSPSGAEPMQRCPLGDRP